MSERDRHYLQHILDSIRRIEEYTADGKEAFDKNTMVQDAVLRNIEIIGEAAKSLSEELKALSPATPWRRIGRMRDKLIHHYFGVDLDLVWEVVARHVPALRREVEAMLAGPDRPRE